MTDERRDLVILYEPPGSGKSTVADCLSDQATATHLRIDDFCDQMFMEPDYSQGQADVVFSELVRALECNMAKGCLFRRLRHPNPKEAAT